MTDPTPIVLGGIAMLGMVTIIITLLFINYHKRKLQHNEVLAAIEKGIDVPITPKKVYNRKAQGILWTTVGVAMFLAFYISSGSISDAIWTIVPIAVGVALLLIARLEKDAA